MEEVGWYLLSSLLRLCCICQVDLDKTNGDKSILKSRQND